MIASSTFDKSMRISRALANLFGNIDGRHHSVMCAPANMAMIDWNEDVRPSETQAQNSIRILCARS